MSYVWNLLMAPLRGLADAPRKILGWSLPAKVALVVAIFLWLCVILAYVAFIYSDNPSSTEAWFEPTRIATILVLLLVIPFVVYHAARLWLEPDVSRFPDIDYAWKAGVAELARNGLQLNEIPIFLVLGSTNELQEAALFNATRMSFRVKDFPNGPAALHWYANPDAVYICCTNTCQLSKLAALADKIEEKPVFEPAPEIRAPEPNPRGTMVFGPIDEPPRTQPSIAMSGPIVQQAAPRSDIRGTMNIRGTMMVTHDGGSDEPVAAPAKVAISLSPQDATEQQERLKYVCQLLNRARMPLCPINGVLTLLPYKIINRSAREGTVVQRAVKEDLAELRKTLKLRCPVTALVGGLEQESGFRELVRRLGPERARAQRFGKGFGTWAPLNEDQLRALSIHSCGAFEDFVYALFRESDSLSKPGNTKLYHLLCKIRHQLHDRLTNILVAGYAPGNDQEPGDSPLLFSGCYFAATGEGEGQQAFVKGVFSDKLLSEQEELEWTAAAWNDERRYRWLAFLGLGIDALLVAAIGAMIALYKLDMLPK